MSWIYSPESKTGSIKKVLTGRIESGRQYERKDGVQP